MDSDPHIRHVFDENTAALQKKFSSILSEPTGDFIELSLARQELLDVACIVEGLNYLGIEDYFPDRA